MDRLASAAGQRIELLGFAFRWVDHGSIYNRAVHRDTADGSPGVPPLSMLGRSWNWYDVNGGVGVLYV